MFQPKWTISKAFIINQPYHIFSDQSEIEEPASSNRFQAPATSIFLEFGQKMLQYQLPCHARRPTFIVKERYKKRYSSMCNNKEIMDLDNYYYKWDASFINTNFKGHHNTWPFKQKGPRGIHRRTCLKCPTELYSISTKVQIEI